MKIYVDSVSGYSSLISLSNARFTELGKDLDKSKVDEQMRVLHLFERCYFEGAVSSRCGRRVIDAAVLIKNLNKTISKLQTKLGSNTMRTIIRAAFDGVTDSCAWGDQSDGYEPEPVAPAPKKTANA